MKRLIFLMMLIPGVALAQVGPEVYRVATPSQVQGFNATSQTTVTEAVLNRIIRATCTGDCFIWINASGQSFPASKTTGVFLPANVPESFIVSPGSTVNVIGSADGSIYIQELTK